MRSFEWRERLWSPGHPEGLYRVLATLLAPAEWLYRLGVGLRSRAYALGWLPSHRPPIPTLIVGNLTVGGSGKTPISAWCARELRARGRNPSVVMRGYGDDETRVHTLLNPEVPVQVAPRRIAGIRAAAEGGADCVVLDDAFQHRAVRGHARMVLVAAEEWTEAPRLLPRGPWREPPAALERADLVVITRKTAARTEAVAVGARIRERFPELALARAHIRPAGLAAYESGALRPLELHPGLEYALAVAGVARPETVWAQLEEVGVTIGERWAFPDHHRYREQEFSKIARAADDGAVITTLKDAVKLGPGLAPATPVHVLLQGVGWEHGEERVGELLEQLCAGARAAR